MHVSTSLYGCRGSCQTQDWNCGRLTRVCMRVCVTFHSMPARESNFPGGAPEVGPLNAPVASRSPLSRFSDHPAAILMYKNILFLNGWSTFESFHEIAQYHVVDTQWVYICIYIYTIFANLTIHPDLKEVLPEAAVAPRLWNQSAPLSASPVPPGAHPAARIKQGIEKSKVSIPIAMLVMRCAYKMLTGQRVNSHSYGKSLFLMSKSSLNGHFQ